MRVVFRPTLDRDGGNEPIAEVDMDGVPPVGDVVCVVDARGIPHVGVVVDKQWSIKTGAQHVILRIGLPGT